MLCIYFAGAGLKVLHAHHIVHRDLKPEVYRASLAAIYVYLCCMCMCMLMFEQNILLSDSTSDPVLKIADFGLSR